MQNFGFSFHGAQDEFLALLDAYDWGFCQIQYNYSDENYQVGVTGLKAAAAKGIPVMIMEPLLGGKLAKNLPKAAVKRFAQADPELTPAACGFRIPISQSLFSSLRSGIFTFQCSTVEPWSAGSEYREPIKKLPRKSCTPAYAGNTIFQLLIVNV
ncbi:MAG: hypothetical protein LUE31_00040 [Lachnospiraceae bacterium]|nr:hypothetical protein [Lachnospiraceae bacterium]